MKYAEVIVSSKNKNLDKIFNYSIPEEMKQKIEIGMRAFVPFGKGNRLKEGYIVGFCDEIEIEEETVKPIYSLPDKYSIFNKNTILLAKYMSKKYYCTLAECFQCIMPKILKDKVQKFICINYENPEIAEQILSIKSKKNLQSKVISFLEERKEPVSTEEVKLVLGITKSPIETLLKKKIIKTLSKDLKKDIYNYEENYYDEKFELTKEQEAAFSFLKSKLISKDKKKPTLLNGVTGSGKTEVYLKITEEVLKAGKQVIVLVPEISLTAQTVEKFIQRFGRLATLTHSKLSSGERFDQWKKAKNSEISIMIGARSAIFTPFENLGLIIIDEEHESTYKSEGNPKYCSKEVAEKISSLTDCLVVYGSATPAIETYYKTTIKEYDLITMTQRVNKTFPDINIVDMRNELKEANYSIFSRPLFEAIKQNLQNNMQTILFLNRRGHSTFVSCRKCGYAMECANCNINYTYHLDRQKLICHYCNTTIPNPTNCPSCGSSYIKYFGIGTQKIEQEIKKFFPTARVLRMDLDTTTKKSSHQQILKKFKDCEADILIGTQMIAKGLDFPKVSVVGVIAADLSIHSGDYKSAENSFQLLTQVSGRAGRNEHLGKVFIQTYLPEHYSIQFAKQNDYLGFYEKEIKQREEMFYPPFSNLFFILISGKDETEVKEKAKFLFSVLKYYNKKLNYELLGPAPANIYKINKNFRYKIIIKGKEEERIKNFVLYCVEKFKTKTNVNNINITLSLNPSFIQ